jgi:hypothetical protein
VAPDDVMVTDWQAAGLLVPSEASLDRLLTVKRAVVLRQLGVLTPTDLNLVRSTWSRHMRL